MICIEDVLGWWPGHDQPFALDDVLAAEPEEAMRLVERGQAGARRNGRTALTLAGAEVIDRAFWRWPFAGGTDYLVCATVARA